MKKLSKILVLVLSLALLAGALVLAISAADEKPYKATGVWTQEEVIAVYQDEAAFKADKADGKYTDALAKFNELGQAFAYCKANKETATYVALTADWEAGTNTLNGYNPRKVDSSMTLDLNGHTLIFSVNQKDGKDACWNNMVINAGNLNFTIVGNGGTIESSAAIVQHNNKTSKVFIKGGEGGITLRGIPGFNYNTETGELNENTVFAGTQMFKIGDDQHKSTTSIHTAELTATGDITIENYNAGQSTGFKVVFNVVGSSVLNVGTEEEPANIYYKDYMNVDHGSNLHGLVNVGYYSKTEAKGIYDAHTVTPTISFVNADIELFSEKLLTMTSSFKAVGDDDVVKFVIKNSYITADDYAERSNPFASSNNNNTSFKGLVYIGNSANPLHIDVDNSSIYTKHNQMVFYSDGSTAGTIGRTFVTVDDSDIHSLTITNGKYPIARNIGNVIYSNSYLETDNPLGFGALWLPYDETDTSVAWPWFIKAGLADGIGSIVNEGCWLTIDLANIKANNNDFKSNRTMPAGYHTGKNYHAISYTTDEANAKAISTYSVKYGAKLYYLTTNYNNFVSSDTGVVTFDSLTAGTVYKDRTKNPSGFGLSVNMINGNPAVPRGGQFTVEKALVDNATKTNNYITHNYWADTEGISYNSSAPFFYFYATGLGKTFDATTKPLWDVTDVKYYTVDFDLMSQYDTFTPFTFQYYFKNYNSAGSSTMNMVELRLTEDGTWRNVSGDDTYKMDRVPGQWNHITIVLDMPVVDGKVATGSLREDAKLRLYIDGKLVHSFSGVVPANLDDAANYSYYDEEKTQPKAALAEVRMSFAGQTKPIDKRGELSIDNISFFRFPLEAAATLEEAAAYATNASAEAGITAPADRPMALYKGKYYSAENIGDPIFAQAEDYYYGDDVTYLELLCDYPGKLDPIEVSDAIPEDLCFKYKTNGYKLDIADGRYITKYDEETDIYTVTVASAEDIATITFVNGDNIETLEAFKGVTVSAESFPVIANPTVDTTTNPYINLVMGGWSTVAGAKALTEIVVNEDVTLYPAVSDVQSKLGDILFNIAANDNITIKYYIPAEWVKGDGIKVADGKGFFSYTGDSNSTSRISVSANATHTFGGKAYHSVTLWPSMSAFDTDIYFGLLFEVTVGEDTYQVKNNYTTSVYEYCEGIIDGNYTAEEKTLIANYVRYMYSYIGLLAINSPTTTKYAASYENIGTLYNKCQTLCTAYEADLLSEDNCVQNTAAIDQYIDTFSVSANSTRMQFVINFHEGVKKVEINTRGFVAADVDGYAKEGTVKFDTRAANNTMYDSGCYKTYKTENTKPYHIFGTINIILEVVDPTDETKTIQVAGTYSMADYYQVLAATDGVDAGAYAEVFYAAKEFGDSVAAYRFKKVN